MQKEENKNVKMSLTLKKEFYETLKDRAERDHLKTSTWTKQFLMKQVEDLLEYETFAKDCPF
jgi:predicted DNA-binding ribbon-helix-helix protein